MESRSCPHGKILVFTEKIGDYTFKEKCSEEKDAYHLYSGESPRGKIRVSSFLLEDIPLSPRQSPREE